MNLSTNAVTILKNFSEINKNILVKSEKIDETGHKIILSREESEQKVSQAVFVVEGANLIRNEYGNRLFADFFFFITGFYCVRGFFPFSIYYYSRSWILLQELSLRQP